MKHIWLWLALTCLSAHADMESQLRAIEDYFNHAKTFQADFIQVNPDGTEAEGIFYLSRPDQLKFQYNKPHNGFILADQGWLVFFDPALNDYAYMDVEFSPAKFFLQKHVSLGGNIVVARVQHNPNSILEIALTDKEKTAEVTLIFRETPLMLLGWVVRDGEGQETRVTLHNLQKDVPINSALYRYKKPLASQNRS